MMQLRAMPWMGAGRAGTALRMLLGAAVLVGGLACYLLARSTIADMQAMLDNRREATARLRAAAVQSRQVLETPQSETSTALAGDFLTGTQDPIIVADLQNRLRALAIANNVEFNSANTLPVREAAGIDYLGLRIQLRGQLRDLQSVLHAIEAGMPLLFVDRMAMRVDTWPIKSTDPTRDGAAALVAELDVVGARQPPVGGRRSGSATDAPSEGGASAPLPWLSTRRGGRS